MTRGARLIGVGTGPGDPELVTLKAVRALQQVDVVAHFCKAGRVSHAREAVRPHLPSGVCELSLGYPVTTEIPRTDPEYARQIDHFYDASAKQIAEHLDAGRSVAVLSEGDPFFYGSYMHLHVRLAARYPTEVIPGVSSPAGCWSEAGLPLMQGTDVLCVLPATLDETELEERLARGDAAVILKLGRQLPKVRRALAGAGRLEHAIYVEHGTTNDSHCVPLTRRDERAAPYFSLVLVPAWAPGIEASDAARDLGRRERERGSS